MPTKINGRHPPPPLLVIPSLYPLIFPHYNVRARVWVWKCCKFLYISVFLTFRCGGGSNVALNVIYIRSTTQGFYHAVFKISSGTSKNKINVATDITVLIILSAVDSWGRLFRTDKTVRLDLFWRKRPGKKGILMSNQTAGINHKPVHQFGYFYRGTCHAFPT